MSTPPFDARPLTAPVDREAARALAHRLRAQGLVPPLFTGSAALGALVVVIVLSIFASTFLTMGVTYGITFAVAGGGELALWSALSMLLPLLVIGGTLGILIVRMFGGTLRRRERWYRLDGFARANGMTYLPQFDNPGLPGMIFTSGSARQATDLVRGEQPRFVEFANYRYTTGSGKNRTVHSWGYVAVKLDAPLPHIVLDALSNNGLFGSNLPASFDSSQRLKLEGDFDRYFALYCPAGYERDALYLFTPDIMARFIDNAAALDVEIVDDWLFLYAKRDFSTLDPATWAWLFSVVAALLDKLAQWSRWRDDRLANTVPVITPAPAPDAALPFVAPVAALRPPPGVAQPGLRLKRAVPVSAWIVGGVVLLFWLLMQLGVLDRLFG